MITIVKDSDNIVTFNRSAIHTNKKQMGRIHEQQKEWPTLCLRIQDPADVTQGIRILRGEESLGKIRCIQL